MLDIQKNVKLSDYSTFKIGGPAKEFVVVKSEKELIEVLEYAKEKKMKYFILGGGSNVLFDDKGYDGLVIRISGSGEGIKIIKNEETLKGGESYDELKTIEIKCWAGETLSDLINFARNNELSGLEWAVGIPGTVGGAISGNAGAFGEELSNVIESVRFFKIPNFVFPSANKILSYDAKKCNFGYRESLFSSKLGVVILSAKIKLQKREKKEIQDKMKEFVSKRNEKQPVGWYGSAGSFFKNPVVNNVEIIKKFENEKKTTCQDKKIPAGWLIEEAGLKGEKFGNIAVSDVNANFLINTGNGTMEEIIIAAGIIKQKVKIKFGVELKEEVKYVNY